MPALARSASSGSPTRRSRGRPGSTRVSRAPFTRGKTTPEGADVASRVLLDRGNFTFRAFFESGSEPGEHWRPLMSDLEAFGCWFDTWNERLVAISTAPEHAQAVADYL